MRDFLNAAAPVQTVAGRLRQMKELAKEFTAVLRLAGRSPTELRLLPQPVYRYGSEANGILDGALFLFAQGTDPEVMLLLEAIDRDGGPRWQYGFARTTWAPVEALHQDRVAWSVDYWNRIPEPDRTYIVFKGMRID